jgi:quinol monooxygenase YgiN
MRRVILSLAVFALLFAIRTVVAQQNAGAKSVYVVTHVDIIGGNTGNVPQAIQAMKEFAAESRKDAGAVRFEVLQQDSRANHFTLLEVWQSREAFEAHSGAEHTKRFRERVQPMLGSPFDERLHSLL